MADLLLENPEQFRAILDAIAGDIAILTQKIIQQGGVDGIYLSTQEIQDERITPELYQTYIEPSNIAIWRQPIRLVGPISSISVVLKVRVMM